VRYLCLLIVMMTTVVLMAADPVGRVTSSGPLTLNGKAVPATAVSSLPVVTGDEIVTSSSSALIFFGDKSRATIESNSRVKLEPNGSSVTLRVLSGSVDLNRAAGSQVKLIQPILPAAPKSAAAPASGKQTPASDGARKPCHHPPPRSKRCPPGDRDSDCDGDCDKDQN
jgi:hypothetical protein